MNGSKTKPTRAGWSHRALNLALMLVLILAAITPGGVTAVKASPSALNAAPAPQAQSGTVTLTVDNPAVNINAGETATNAGAYQNPNGNPITLSASIGALTRSDNPPGVTVTVPATAGPWSVAANPGLAYFYSGAAAPVVISSINGASISTFTQVKVEYVSGLVDVHPYGTSRPADARGDATFRTGQPYPNNAPAYWTGGGPFGALMGSWTNNAGQIVPVNGIIAPTGNSAILNVPAGATQLQLGVNDEWDPSGYANNTGAWQISVIPVSPAPALTGAWSWSYTADATTPSQDVTITATDDVTGATASVSFALGVNHPNTPPVANPDSYSTDFGVELTVPAPGVLANDSDAEGDPLTAAKASDPANGALALNADGSFSYTPNAGFSGDDSFTYTVNDGALNSNVATVTITVMPPVGDISQLGYWKFDDGSGATALDSSDYHNNGALSGGAAFSASAAPVTYYANPGSISMSAASSSLMTVPNNAINKLTNNFTVMGWVNPSSLSGIQRMISSARTKTSGNGWAFGTNASWLYFSAYGVKDYLTPLSTGMSTGKWYHLAAVMDGSNAVTFYVDGVAFGTVAGSAPAIADTDDALLIGASTSGSSGALAYPFNGLIDDVKVFNRALSAAEIADQMGLPPCSETVLRARFMLGEKLGTITLDGACTYTLTGAADAYNGGNGLNIATATRIEGNGATIERSAAAPQFRLMSVSPAITINNLTLRGGSVPGNGGALLLFGNTTLNNVRFENNASKAPAGVTYVQAGGAVYALANLTVNRAGFIANKTDGFGGAIYFNGATGRVANSVFADNLSGGPGAAIASALASGSLTLLNNSFTNQFKNEKEALLVNGSATVQNNIFDNYVTGITVSGVSAAVSEDYNLFAAVDLNTQALSSGVLTSGGHSRGAAAPRFANPAGRDYRLQSNSPAIDFGTDAGLPSDAAGLPRPASAGTQVDIGAYEYQGVGVPSISITKVGPPFAAQTGQTQFVLTVINEGATTLSDLRISDPLPAGASYVPGSASGGGTLSGGTLTWNLPPLAPNQKARAWYQVTASQDLVNSGYSVTSVSNPAVTASGPDFTTPFNASFTALGFAPFPDGWGFANWGEPVFDADITVADMPVIYGNGVCKVTTPTCVLNAAAEAQRQVLAVTSSGGHCGGMAMSSMYIYDHARSLPGTIQPGALNTVDVTRENARNTVVKFHSTQTATVADVTGLAPYDAAVGAAAVVNKLLENFANPAAADRYTLWFFKYDLSAGHAVVPYGVQKIDNDHYWIYVYDVNYPNNYQRVFKVTMSTQEWVYEGAAINPDAPASAWWGDATKLSNFKLKSLRYAERFPKKCTTACTPDPVTAAANAPLAALNWRQLLTNPFATASYAPAMQAQTVDAPAYEFQLEGEGALMITRSDGLRAGMDPASGEFIAEIPGAEQILSPTGLVGYPGAIRIPHEAGMTYSLRISDRQNAYGNPTSMADLNILGQGFVARLKGLKIDSPADPEAVQPGSNDVLGVVFDGDNHSLSFTSSALDSDTPALKMAVSQRSAPDYTFEVAGAPMPSGRTLSAAIDPATGMLTITNNDPAGNQYNLSVERINMDGSKTTFTGVVSEGPSGTNVDLGPSWTGGQPAINNHAPVAANDAYTATAGAVLTVAAPGVLGNDTDADGNLLTAVKVSNPLNGTLTLNANGGFSYQPNAGFAGSDSFTYKASDGRVDSNVATVSIAIKYLFSGFFQPVDNAPTLNQVKAGSAVPIKFSLGGNQGLNIFAPGYPKIQRVACDTHAPVDDIEQTTTSNSGLTYDPATGQYTYVWKTAKSLAGTCQQFTLRLLDGTDHIAVFKLK